MKLTSPSNFINRNKMISRSVKGKGINPVLELMEEYYYDRNNPDRVNLPDFFGVKKCLFKLWREY